MQSEFIGPTRLRIAVLPAGGNGELRAKAAWERRWICQIAGCAVQIGPGTCADGTDGNDDTDQNDGGNDGPLNCRDTTTIAKACGQTGHRNLDFRSAARNRRGDRAWFREAGSERHDRGATWALRKRRSPNRWRQTGSDVLNGRYVAAPIAALTFSTTASKPAGSSIAIWLSVLRSSVMPADCSPWMNSL